MIIMKKTLNNNKWMGCLGLLVMLMVGASCEKSLMSYEGAENIYFSMQKNADPEEDIYLPDATFNLMNYAGDEVEFVLNVMITGNAKDYDRPYLVTYVADSTTAVAGTDFILPEGGIIKAGQVSDSLRIKLIKNDKLLDTEVKLTVQVLPNEHFSTNLTQFGHDGRDYNIFDPRMYKITYSSIMPKPYYWEYYSTTDTKENGNIGYFTAEKITLINELYGLTYADWLSSSEGGTGAMNTTRVKVIYKKFALYLIEQYKNRTPVLEKDGRLMWVTGCPWDSYVGQPWDGNYINID